MLVSWILSNLSALHMWAFITHTRPRVLGFKGLLRVLGFRVLGFGAWGFRVFGFTVLGLGVVGLRLQEGLALFAVVLVFRFQGRLGEFGP